MDEQKKKNRVSGFMTVILIGSAIIADLLSLIPLVGFFTGPIYWILVSFYLWKIGCGFVNVKQLTTKALSMLGEMIPAIQALPLALVGIIIVLVLIKIEDKTGIKVVSIASGKNPLNKDGVRLPPVQNPIAQSSPLNTDGIRPPSGGLNN